MSNAIKRQPILVQRKIRDCRVFIAVQEEVFLNEQARGGLDPLQSDSQEYDATLETGAEVRFIGRVREQEQDANSETRALNYLELEHYPAMTESSLLDICEQAIERWSPQQLKVIHRVGCLSIGEEIVLVEVLAAHRKAAFESCEFVMDYLKTSAPFWKKAVFKDGETNWIGQRQRDRDAAKRW